MQWFSLEYTVRVGGDASQHLISRSATTPGRYRWGFLTPPVAGADLRATRVASCLRGALPPVERRAVCLVRAIVRLLMRRRGAVTVSGPTTRYSAHSQERVLC